MLRGWNFMMSRAWEVKYVWNLKYLDEISENPRPCFVFFLERCKWWVTIVFSPLWFPNDSPLASEVLPALHILFSPFIWLILNYSIFKEFKRFLVFFSRFENNHYDLEKQHFTARISVYLPFYPHFFVHWLTEHYQFTCGSTFSFAFYFLGFLLLAAQMTIK
jgi:hypothetical protein